MKLIVRKSQFVHSDCEGRKIVTVQLNASITVLILTPVRHGRKKAKIKVKYEKSKIFPEARKSLKSNLQPQSKVTPVSPKAQVCAFHALMYKRKQMQNTKLNKVQFHLMQKVKQPPAPIPLLTRMAHTDCYGRSSKYFINLLKGSLFKSLLN